MAVTKPLFERLKDLPETEHDRVLAQVWKDFKGTDAHEALLDMLRRLHGPAFKMLLAAETPPERRCYAAGVAYVTDTLMVTLQAVTNVDLSAFFATLTGPEPQEPSEDFIPKEEVPY
jgi:hypothetical protein